MPNLEKCTPEYARELLRGHHKEWMRMNRSLERCKRLIEDKKDYSFLLEMGYSIGDAEAFQDAFDLLQGEACFLEVLLMPFMEFLRVIPPMAFYTEDAPIYSRIISESDFFRLLLALDSVDQEEYLQKLAKNTDCLQLLRDSLKKKDESLFISTLRDYQIDTTHLGQFLSTMQELGRKPSTYSDIVNTASTFQEATKVTIPLPEQVPFFKDNGHYLTRKNCVSSFVSAWQSVDCLFGMASAEAYGLYRLSLADKLPYQLNYALSVFFKEKSFEYLLSFLNSIGFIDETSVNSLPDVELPRTESHELRPLVKPPQVFSDEKFGEVKCRSFFKKMVRCKDHWFREEDIECFLYLLNVTSARPQFLRRVIWFGNKFELKCLIEVLYPNRKRREKPDYGDMAQVFCDKDGKSFNLNSNPLQKRMNHITSPRQAAEEERIMKKFARFAGVV